MISQAYADRSLNFKVIGGEESSIAQLMEPDKWTVVMLWAKDCHVCNQEAGKYNDFHRQHSTKDAKIIGVSLDGTEESAKEFVDRHQLEYPNLVGNVRDVAKLYGAETGESFRATPSFMLFDPTGKLRAAQAGGVSPEVVEAFMTKSQASDSTE